MHLASRVSLPDWLAHRSLWTALSVVAVGVGLMAFGLASIPLGWLLAGTATLTLAAWLFGRTLEDDMGYEQKYRLLLATIGVLSVFITGSWSYHRWWDPANVQDAWEFVPIRADEANCIPLSGEPGGPGLLLAKNNQPLNGLCGGQSYAFQCRVVLANGETWMRLYGTTYWAPASKLRPINGTTNTDPRDCAS